MAGRPESRWDSGGRGRAAGLPSGRDSRPASVFLADEPQSGFVNGEVLGVHGGVHVPFWAQVEPDSRSGYFVPLSP